MSSEKEESFSVERMRARNMVSNIASGSGDGRLDEESDKLSIIIHEITGLRENSSSSDDWMEEKLQSLDKMKDEIEEDKDRNDKKPRIQRIPVMLRESKSMEESYYVPRVICLGPLHHGHPKFQVTEHLKLKLTVLFIIEHNIQKKYLYKKIESFIIHLKGRYDEEDIERFNDQELTWMFLVDGCSTLHYVDYAANGNISKLQIKKDQVAFGHHDIFLLENQVPFELLQLIMDSCPNGKGELLLKSIYKFIRLNVQETRGDDPSSSKELEGGKSKLKSTPPTHLLDLLRNELICESSLKSDQEKMNSDTTTETKQMPENEIGRGWSSFRSVSELKNAGIKMKSLKSGSLKNIYFSNDMLFEMLFLPTLTVDDSTASKFLNLIAYEMCPDFYNDFEVTSYICFMGTLIDLPNDVKVLRDAHVLLNNLGSDEHVAKLFNNISTNLVPNEQLYSRVKTQIQKYYDVKYKTWIAQGINDHFSTPWTAIAFVAVVFELVMSFIQAFYAVKDNGKK